MNLTIGAVSGNFKKAESMIKEKTYLQNIVNQMSRSGINEESKI